MSSSYKRRNQLSLDQDSPNKMDTNGELMAELEDTNALDDTDMIKDRAAKKFIDGLRKVGPFSKHILNYSYPPLLYQRGDDDEEDEDQTEDQGECDEDEEDDLGNSQEMDGDGMGQLPEFHDSEDDLAGNDLRESSDRGHQNRMPANDEE